MIRRGDSEPSAGATHSKRAETGQRWPVLVGSRVGRRVPACRRSRPCQLLPQRVMMRMDNVRQFV